MAMNDQVIVNPPASFRSTVWKYYVFQAVNIAYHVVFCIIALKFNNQKPSIEIEFNHKKYESLQP